MGKKILFYAEDDRNEAKLVAPIPDGIGLDGLWTDDYHHQVRGELATTPLYSCINSHI
jgi:maltooligosyltrehalose trehalohydrolase